MLVPIGLHAVTALVALTVSSGFILAPPPYRMVNAGSCDYKKKKKKKKKITGYIFFALVLESVQPQDSLSTFMNDVRSNA